MSKRNNPELYKEIQDKYNKLRNSYYRWSDANSLKKHYLALLNCKSNDKRPEDLQNMKKLGLKMQKIIPQIYVEFPNLKF